MTGLRRHPTPNRHCWLKSTGSTALPPASNQSESLKATLALSLIETELADQRGTRTKTMTNITPVDCRRILRLLGALAGLSVALGACTYTGAEVVTPSVPNDYRLRHPIAVEEADRSIVIFVGRARGGLSAPQRADVIGLARTWVREGTGAIVVDVPVDTPNARAAAVSFQEIQSLLTAGGVPPRGAKLHQYHPDDPRT